MEVNALNLIENTSYSGQSAIDQVDHTTWIHPEYRQLMQSHEPLSNEEEHQLAIKLFENGDKDAAQLLVYSNLRGVLHIASDYRGYGLPLMDLLQEGTIGLMKAVRKFDPWRNVRLYTFSIPWIKAEIQEYILNNWKLVKAATTDAKKKLFFNLRKLKSTLKLDSKQETTERIAEKLDVSIKDVNAMDIYMNESIVDIVDVDIVDSENTPLQAMENLEEHQTIERMKNAVTELNEREQKIIQERFYQEPPTTLEEMANRWGISMQRVQQLEQNALKKLRTKLLR